MNRTLAALVLALLTGTALAGGAPGGPPGGGGPPQMPPAPVRVAAVTAMPVKAGRTFLGTVEPSRRSLVGSEFAGLVVEYLAREGDRVSEGQPLARLRMRLLDLRIQSAQAQLTQRRERLRELENGSRPEEVAQARTRLAQAQAELDLRLWRRESAQRLYEQKTISEDELRDAGLALRAAELTRDAARSALELVEAGPREEQIAQARAEIAVEEAGIARLEEERERYTISAPFAGWVVAEHTEVGQWLAVGAPVAEIAALDPVDVVVDVVEDFVGGLAVGASVRVAIDALAGRILTGTIDKIVSQADRRGRTFPVRLRLANEVVGELPLIRAGMSAEATLAVGGEEPGLFVPKDAVVLGGPQPVVWSVDAATGTAQPVPVLLGVAVGDQVQVKGPLPPDRPVVVRGNERLMFPGQPVVVQP